MAVLYFYWQCCYRAAINKLLPEGQIFPLFLYSPQAMAFYIFKWLKKKKSKEELLLFRQVCHNKWKLYETQMSVANKVLLKHSDAHHLHVVYGCFAQQQSWAVVKNSFANSCYKRWETKASLCCQKQHFYPVYFQLESKGTYWRVHSITFNPLIRTPGPRQGLCRCGPWLPRTDSPLMPLHLGFTEPNSPSESQQSPAPIFVSRTPSSFCACLRSHSCFDNFYSLVSSSWGPVVTSGWAQGHFLSQIWSSFSNCVGQGRNMKLGADTYSQGLPRWH